MLSSNAVAQAGPPVCTPIDRFESTNSPGVGFELTTASPAAQTFLDSDPTGAIGGFRNISFGPLTSGGGLNTDAELTIGPSPANLILSSNGPRGIAPFSLLYDANGAGLMQDLSNATSISIEVLSNDQSNTLLQVTLTDAGSNAAQFSVSNLPNNLSGDTFPQDVELPIASFTGIGAVDLSNIFSIEILVSPTLDGSDLALGESEFCESIVDPVPDPSPGPSPAPQPPIHVPTMPIYGLVTLAGLLAGGAWLRIRRSRNRFGSSDRNID